ncbi:mitotic checkpoint serine/threonine-protein kinase BUB1 beta [Striga asiatica]|uniref:Mitotic checkpoint serine/threonine-protein kinase BUB1 beta n=1 Tax=Striga asiatica TaxID=4170 RepID=A0A5A7QXA6_STRAF|nr:mitotic checkpoint serine/threonine-protein kinase BUB1 beta [Striga asiatica]
MTLEHFHSRSKYEDENKDQTKRGVKKRASTVRTKIAKCMALPWRFQDHPKGEESDLRPRRASGTKEEVHESHICTRSRNSILYVLLQVRLTPSIEPLCLHHETFNHVYPLQRIDGFRSQNV